MGKDYDEKDLREIDYKKGKDSFRIGNRGKFKGTVVEEKDARGTIHRPAKRMMDGRGTLREVEFEVWRNEVIKNPLGPTAQRAKKAKDPDLDNIKVDVIAIKQGKQRDTGLPRPRERLVRGERVTDLRGISRELQQRPGFTSVEDTIDIRSEKEKRKDKVKKDGKKNK